VDSSGCIREGGNREGGLTGGGGQWEAKVFGEGRSLAGRRLGLQVGTALRLSPGDGKWRRRCRPASRSSGRRQFAPAVLPCWRIEDEPVASLAPWRRHAAARRLGLRAADGGAEQAGRARRREARCIL
jgi:hypothetical protein